MMSKDSIEQIFNILDDAGIKNFTDIPKTHLIRGKLLSAKQYPWICDLAQIINSLYYKTEEHISKIDGQIFLVDKIKENTHNNILKYSCVFPERMIISSGEFHYLEEAKNASVDIDFFKKLFLGKDLLLNDIVHISPFYRCTNINDGDGDFNNSLIESLALSSSNTNKIAQLDKSGIGNIQQLDFVNNIFLVMPWLNDVRIEDYLEIIENNKTEFELYNNKLAKLSENTKNTEQFLKQFKLDLEEANCNIKIALEKKQSELKRKGILVTIGICLTAVPFLLPYNSDIDPSILSAIFGSVNTLGIANDFSDIKSFKKIGNDNPFWVLWKWQNS